MAKIIKTPITAAFEPFQIVIDIDSPLKALVYSKIFGNTSSMSQLIASMSKSTSSTDIHKILDDEFSDDEWAAAFKDSWYDYI